MGHQKTDLSAGKNCDMGATVLSGHTDADFFSTQISTHITQTQDLSSVVYALRYPVAACLQFGSVANLQCSILGLSTI